MNKDIKRLKYLADRKKLTPEQHQEFNLLIKLRLLRIEQRLDQLESATSPHRLAGYD